MKRSTSLIVFGAVLVVLVVGFYVVKALPKKAPTTSGPTIVVSKVDENKITLVTLRHGGTTIRLSKQGAGWTVDYPQPFDWDSVTLRNIAGNLSKLDAERLVDADPTDLSQYGLDPPQATAEVSLSDGTKVRILIGNKTVEGSAYYVMKEGDKAVYTVLGYSVDPLLSSIDELRNKVLPQVDTKSLTYVRIVGGGRNIEIEPLVKGDDMSFVSFATMKLVKPYPVPRPVDSENFEKLFEQYPNYFQIQKFVDDSPRNLAKYGLQPPVLEFELRDKKSHEIDLDLGNTLPDGTEYAKLAGEPSVFTIDKTDVSGIQGASAFGLEDKFLLIPNIEDVDGFTISEPGTQYEAKIVRTRGGAKDASGNAQTQTTYYLDGKTIEEGKFKGFYQSVIGLLADAPNPNPLIPFNPVTTVTFRLSKGKGEYQEYFVPYNRDFFAAFRDGVADLLISRAQVNAMFQSAAGLLK